MKSNNISFPRHIFVVFISCLISFPILAKASNGIIDKSVIKDPQRETFFSLKMELERLNGLIAGNNNNADYFYNRGWIYEKMNDAVKAEKDYSAAIKLDKGHVDALYNRGLIYLKSKRYALAVRDFSGVDFVISSKEEFDLNLVPGVTGFNFLIPIEYPVLPILAQKFLFSHPL